MKRTYGFATVTCVFLALLAALMFTACSPVDETGETLPGGIPLEVSEYYIEFLELVKIDRRSAVYQYCHFEDADRKEATANAPNLDEYEIIAWEKLSDKLWEVEVKLTDEIFRSGAYGVNYVAKIDGRYYVITGITQIPAELKEGVEIEPYEPYGEEIIDPEDIVGEITVE